jgi:hypothetical protein
LIKSFGWVLVQFEISLVGAPLPKLIQPSSDGLPEGLIDQRFSAGSTRRGDVSALQRALKLHLSITAKAFSLSPLKRALKISYARTRA